jgi:hypothetical protein
MICKCGHKRWKHDILSNGQAVCNAQISDDDLCECSEYENWIDEDHPCPVCHGTVGHRINCPDGIAFSEEKE